MDTVALGRFWEAVGAKPLLVTTTLLPGGVVTVRLPPPPPAKEGVGGMEAVDCGSVPRGVCVEVGLPAAPAPGV